MNTDELRATELFNNSFIECRACLEKMDSNVIAVDLFQAWTSSWEGMRDTVAEDLAKIGNIELSISDRHSKVICHSCFKKLENACSFVAVVRKSDNVLRNRYCQEKNSNSIWPKPIQLDNNLKDTVFDSSMDIEIKQEVMFDTDSNEHASGSLDVHYKDISDCVEIKIEPEEMMMDSAIQINGTFSYKSTDEANKTYLLNGKEMLEEYLDTDLKEEPTSENDSDVVSTDLPLECMLCAKAFRSVSGLKAHVITYHSYKSVKRKTGRKHLSVNKDKLACEWYQGNTKTPTELMVHETCQNKATDYSCNQKFDIFKQLTGHPGQCRAITKKDHPSPKILEEVQRAIEEEHKDLDDDELPQAQLQCHLCPEKFSDSYYMTIHQEIHHSGGDQLPVLEPLVSMETETLQSIFSEDK